MDDYSKENRRSGLERRKEHIKVPDDRREGFDQRDILRRQQFIINKLKRTAIFQSLTDDQFKTILSICAKKESPKDTEIYFEGDKSDDMFILLDGVLQITIRGKEVNLMTPIGIVGEMGVFTGEPRSYSIKAKSDCTFLRLNKIELFKLFEKYPDLHMRFQNGIIIALSEKLKVSNEVIAKFREKLKLQQ